MKEVGKMYTETDGRKSGGECLREVVDDDVVNWIDGLDPDQFDAFTRKLREKGIDNIGSDKTWWAYECFGECCNRPDEKPTSGLILDIRTDDQFIDPNGEPPKVICPICGEQMTNKGHWDADPNGYGSRADRANVSISRGSLGILVSIAESLPHILKAYDHANSVIRQTPTMSAMRDSELMRPVVKAVIYRCWRRS